MKLLGIDYGRRRIGIAVTDETGICIRGLTTIDQQKENTPFNSLQKIIAEESPEALIVGIPLGPYDEETRMSQEVRSFVNKFIEECAITLPVHFVDESFSSSQADQLLRSKKKKARRNKNNRDQLAACYILETFQKEQQ